MKRQNIILDRCRKISQKVLSALGKCRRACECRRVHDGGKYGVRWRPAARPLENKSRGSNIMKYIYVPELVVLVVVYSDSSNQIADIIRSHNQG